MKNIAVLDGYILNPGDLTWEGLEFLGKCVVYDRTPPEEVVPRAKDSEIILTNKTIILCRPFVDYASTMDIIVRGMSPKNDSGK
jgi:hypothetical protein